MKLTEEQKKKIWNGVYACNNPQGMNHDEFMGIVQDVIDDCNDTGSPRTDELTGHCVCHATYETDVVPRSLAVELETSNRQMANKISDLELHVDVERSSDDKGCVVMSISDKFDKVFNCMGDDVLLSDFKKHQYEMFDEHLKPHQKIMLCSEQWVRSCDLVVGDVFRLFGDEPDIFCYKVISVDNDTGAVTYQYKFPRGFDKQHSEKFAKWGKEDFVRNGNLGSYEVVHIKLKDDKD